MKAEIQMRYGLGRTSDGKVILRIPTVDVELTSQEARELSAELLELVDNLEADE